MFDIGGIEFLIVLIVALLVVGPKELPALLRTLGKYAGMLKKQASEFRTQFDDVLKESEFSDIKKDFETMGEDAASEMRDVEKSVGEGLEEFDDHSNLDDDDFPDIEEQFEALEKDSDKQAKSNSAAKSESKAKSEAEAESEATDETRVSESSNDNDTDLNDAGLDPDPDTAHEEPPINGAPVSNGHDHGASGAASKDAGATGEVTGTERKSGT